MAINPITPLPPAPTRDDPVNFSARGDALMTALVTMVPQMNASFSQVDQSTESAAASAATAVAKAAEADASAVASASGASAPKWVSGASYVQGACVFSPVNFLTYRRKVAGSGTVDPSLDTSNWGAPVALPGQTGASNTTMTASVVLTAGQMGALFYTPAAHGLSVMLPVASTCRPGTAWAMIENGSDVLSLGVLDAGGNLKCVIGPQGTASIGLADNTGGNATNGIWVIDCTEEQGGRILNEWTSAVGQYSGVQLVTSPESREGTSFTSVPLGGDLHVALLNAQSPGLVYLVAANAATGAIGTPTLIVNAAGNSVTDSHIIPVSATSGIILYNNSTTNNVIAVGFTVNTSTMAVTTAASVFLAGTTSYSFTSVVLSGGGIVVALRPVGNSYISLYGVTLTGNNVAKGTAMTNQYQCLNPTLIPLSATGVGIITNPGDSYQAYITTYTVSATALTVVTQTSVASPSSLQTLQASNFVFLTPTRLLVSFREASGTYITALTLTGAASVAGVGSYLTVNNGYSAQLQAYSTSIALIRTVVNSTLETIQAIIYNGTSLAFSSSSIRSNPNGASCVFAGWADNASFYLLSSPNTNSHPSFVIRKLYFDGTNFGMAFRRAFPTNAFSTGAVGGFGADAWLSPSGSLVGMYSVAVGWTSLMGLSVYHKGRVLPLQPGANLRYTSGPRIKFSGNKAVLVTSSSATDDLGTTPTMAQVTVSIMEVL